MTLPTPNLDDRRFQELVDEAKRYVMRRCPDWTDHNVSDPGVTLIETFAYMTDALLYRLNRVPDRLYVKFLELIGLQLLPATPARAAVTFWLSSPAQAALIIPTGTQVATLRSEVEEPVVFSTVADLAIVPCAYQGVMTQAATQAATQAGPDAAEEEERVDHSEELSFGRSFAAFSPTPMPGDSLIIALNEAVPSCAVLLQFVCSIDGVGVDPTNPPLIWEAWSGSSWDLCETSTDETGGLNRDGAVIVHVPSSHAVAVLDSQRGGWLRARVAVADGGQPEYSSSPIIHGLAAATVGGTVDVVHADVVTNEVVGESEGVPGQRFRVARVPMLTGGAPTIVDVSSDDGWEEWSEVAHFAASASNDRHVKIDSVVGEIAFGPLVREGDGGTRQYGAVPPKGSTIRLRSYAVGGGRRGNVGKSAIRTLKSSIPFVSSVENRAPAIGGVDGENIEEAKERAPIVLRTRGRAVTAEDYEQLTREAAPEVARVRCVAAGTGADAGSVRVLVTPAAPMVRGAIRFEHLVPSAELLARIAEYLDRVRVIGTRLVIEPPTYQGVTVVAQLRARPKASGSRIREDAMERLETYFNPLVGGPDGDGWPWGRPVQAGEAFAVLQGLSGVDLVEDVRLFGANMVTGERGAPTQRLELDPHTLVFSYQHQVRVSES
jgi:predicted phage baseplate assembly protein